MIPDDVHEDGEEEEEEQQAVQPHPAMVMESGRGKKAGTSDVFILDRVAQKMAAEKQLEDSRLSGHHGTKQLNLDRPKITKALSVDDSSHLRLTKPLDVMNHLIIL